jgi:predicted DNA-binding transcriptional regulator AlpA
MSSTKQRSAGKRAASPPPITIRDFDSLPDVARVALPLVSQIYGVSGPTVWRRVRAGLIPAPVREGGSTRWIVGDLRAKLTRQP